VVDQQHRAAGDRPGDREGGMGVAVLVVAVGPLGLRAGTWAHPLDDRARRHPEQPGGLLGEVTDQDGAGAGEDEGDPGWRLLPPRASAKCGLVWLVMVE